MALYIGKKVGSPTVIKEVESGEVISVENNSFNIELETVSGVLKKKSIVGSGSAKTLDIDVVASDSQFEVFDLELDTADNIKNNEDYFVGFTDDVIFYDIIKEEPTNLVNIHPLEITFPSGAIYSHKYNKQINYKSKTVYFYDYTDMFDYPIIGYEDDGSEVLMNMYAIYNDSSCEIVLLNRIMTPSDVPSGFTDYILIKQITIPEHTPFHGEIVQQPWTNPKLTGNGTMGGTGCACAADSYYNSSYYQYYAFDNSTSSYWRNSTNSTPTWITYYTPNAAFVTSVVFSFNSIASAGRIEGSNDNSTWTTIGSFSGNTSSTLTVECSSTKPYKYIRFYRTSTYSGSYGAIYDMTINGFTLSSKWYSKTLLTHIINNGQTNPESFINGSYYSSSSKLVECSSQPLITTNMYEDGCLFKYDDTGYGDLNTKSYVVKNVDSDVYKIAITDKTIEELQGDETIDYVEEVGDFVLPSHYNFIYTGEEQTPNFEIVGSLTNNDCVISGFSSNNYIKLNTPFSPGNKTWEIIQKFTTDFSDTTSGKQLFHSSYSDMVGVNYRYGIGLWIEPNSGTHARRLDYFCSANTSSWLFDEYGSTQLNDNTTYWVKYGWDGYKYYLKLSTDGVTYGADDISFASTTPVYSSLTTTLIGIYKTTEYSLPFSKSIDLNECSITIDGSLWWEGYNKSLQLKDQFQTSCNFLSNDEPTAFINADNEDLNITSNDSFLAPYFKSILTQENYNKIGQIIINSDCIASGFTTSSYVHIPTNYRSTPHSYILKFTTGSSVTSGATQTILHNEYFIACEINSSGWLYSYSWSRNLSENIVQVQPNTTYWVKIQISGNNRTIWISDDGMTWIQKLTQTDNSINNASSYEMRLGLSSYNYATPFNGSFDLKECYILDNSDREVWRAVTKKNKIIGCLVNYEDTGSTNALKAYKVSYTDDSVGVVLSNDETFTVENMDTKTYLADIVIPQHNLFTYGEKTVKTDWKNSKLTSNGTMGGTSPACQTSGYYSSSYYPYYAFDETTNYWHSNTTKPQWITYYTPTEIYVDTIKITLSDYNPMFFEIQGSNNNTTWTTLVDGLNKINSSGQTLEIPVNSENPYKYIRLVNKKGYNSTYTTVREMFIYGHTINSENGWIPVESMWNPMGE